MLYEPSEKQPEKDKLAYIPYYMRMFQGRTLKLQNPGRPDIICLTCHVEKRIKINLVSN